MDYKAEAERANKQLQELQDKYLALERKYREVRKSRHELLLALMEKDKREHGGM
jgi:hypothetical protein